MGVNEAKLQSSDPPDLLTQRKAWVQFRKVNTIVIPHDPEDDNAMQWACKENYPASQPVPLPFSNSEVVYLIDGKETLPQFQCEIEKTAGPGDFIYLLGWYCDVDTVFPSGRTLRQMWTEKAKAGVRIRMMLCGQLHEGHGVIKAAANGQAVSFVNSLSQLHSDQTWRTESIAGGVLDSHFAVRGSHHQKILIVKAGDQITAFCGGVDINPDRIMKTEDGRPLHDVHCRIRGRAAMGLLGLFIDRWNDFNDLTNVPYGAGRLNTLGATTQPTGTFHVQICRTFGRIRTAPYDFAPKGEQSIRKMIENAIQQAQRFIYIEDQYLIELDIARLIAKQLPKLQHVTILIPPTQFNRNMLSLRGEFLDTLYKAATGKVHVYSIFRDGSSCGTYIHAKTWVIDDKFAAIGSANLNYRGYTHDSEVSAGIYDASKNSTLTYTFAHRLRMKLWAHHLDMDNAAGLAELADGVASVGLWEAGHGIKNLRVDKFYNSDGDWVDKGEYWVEDVALDPEGT